MDHVLPLEPKRPGVRRVLGQASQVVDFTKDGVEGNEAVGSGALATPLAPTAVLSHGAAVASTSEPITVRYLPVPRIG